MEREFAKPCLSAVFVDYDNIYFSLKRKNEEAARRFAKDAGSWLSEIVSGRLISPTNALFDPVARRNVMSRCYGNPVPRKNPDQTTDMTSFPFVRHSFLRGGFEVIDCPPLTQQLKNSSDIRMVMDIRDLLSHDTYYDEFIILSGDADFTPLLHRLRAHARRTVVYANDHTAAPYLAICDGEIRESDLTRLLLEGRLPGQTADGGDILIETASTRNEAVRGDIIDEIVTLVREADAPVPLEMLADKVIRTLGHARTVGTGWAGAGNFRELLTQFLPDGIEVSGEPPYVAFERRRLAAPLNVAAAAPQPVPASYQPQLRDDDVAPAAAPGPASALGPVAEPAAMMDARLSLQDAARDLAAGGPARRAAAQDTEVTSAASLQPQAAARHERQSIGQAPAHLNLNHNRRPRCRHSSSHRRWRLRSQLLPHIVSLMKRPCRHGPPLACPRRSRSTHRLNRSRLSKATRRPPIARCRNRR
ncbi:MAG: NYN domain-containing protein [Pseudomonadota bacterium]